MGLDMYLDKRSYVRQWEHIDADKQYNVEAVSYTHLTLPTKLL
jgi:hypothetical protein